MPFPYDSTRDTHDHIKAVRALLDRILEGFLQRRLQHDESKFREPEKSMYDKYTPLLKGSTYGSAEYYQTLEEMGPALQHHYEHNTHHPEHFKTGINGMSLLDLIEMLADWKAASQRHADGSLYKSLEINRERFGISDQLYQILKNTVNELRW